MIKKQFTFGPVSPDFAMIKDNEEPMDTEEVVDCLNKQQSLLEQLQEENLYKNFELKSVDDLKKLKDILEICMVLIDGAIAYEDLELGYESVFQFERRIKKFNGVYDVFDRTKKIKKILKKRLIK